MSEYFFRLHANFDFLFIHSPTPPDERSEAVLSGASPHPTDSLSLGSAPETERVFISQPRRPNLPIEETARWGNLYE